MKYLLLALLLLPSLAFARVGAFGRINGKSFRAPEAANPVGRHCVIAAVGDGVFDLSAGECVGKGRHQRTRRNFKFVGFGCATFDGQDIQPPQDLVCLSAIYVETKTTRTGRKLSEKEWQSTFSFFPLTSMPPQSTVVVHVDAIEGGRVRGSMSGVFDHPKEGTSPSPSSVSIQSFTFDVPIVQ